MVHTCEKGALHVPGGHRAGAYDLLQVGGGRVRNHIGHGRKQVAGVGERDAGVGVHLRPARHVHRMLHRGGVVGPPHAERRHHILWIPEERVRVLQAHSDVRACSRTIEGTMKGLYTYTRVPGSSDREPTRLRHNDGCSVAQVPMRRVRVYILRKSA